MTPQRKVIHVELNEPYNNKHHWYFGSILAIYDTLPVEVVGIAHTSLWNVLSKNGKYTTKTATIRIGVLRSKRQTEARNNVLCVITTHNATKSQDFQRKIWRCGMETLPLWCLTFNKGGDNR